MKTTLKIQNLKCSGCANTIITKLSDLKGVQDISIDNKTNTVTFDYENEVNLIETKDVLTKLGYPEVGDKNAITTKAKSFVSCAIGRMNN